MTELEKAKEKLKGHIFQYVYVSKLIVNNGPLMHNPTKTVEERIKVEKLIGMFDKARRELLDNFDEYFEIEEKSGEPISLGIRSCYNRIKKLR
jgi:hypothetical protein